MKNTITLTVLVTFLTGCVEGRPEDILPLDNTPDATPGTRPLEPNEIQCPYEHTRTNTFSADYKMVVTKRYALISGIPMDSNYCVKTTYLGYPTDGCQPNQAGCTETGTPLPSPISYTCRSGIFNDAGQLVLNCGTKVVQKTNGAETVSEYITKNILYR